MNRTISFLIADVFSEPGLLLIDSAVKGTALLALAAIAVLLLRRDSAATRHLVWLLAMVAMLVVPVLSAVLPEWRVLPKWAGIPRETPVVATSPTSIARSAVGAVELPGNVEPEEVKSPSAFAFQPAAASPASRPALATSQVIRASWVGSWNWQRALLLLWAIGCCLLFLRLMAARFLLWNTERRASVIGSPSQPANVRPPKATQDPLTVALDAARLQLGIRHPVTLMICPDKTIPVVWGILRCRLLLPATARQWRGEQLQSVLLHELAHIKRRDTLALLLAQVACALYWFNPLAWLAAWRLDVERERACDDLVLASGVRPSTYAAHLLDVVTVCSPAHWQQSCGLAIARQSSLESRLVAVLSKNHNRRVVSTAVAGLALIIAVGIAMPIAMLCAADEKPGEKPKSTAAPAGKQPKQGANLQPGQEEKLKWGEPVNGLRAAIVIRHPDKPKGAGELPDLYLVMQNVSKAPIRLTDVDVPPKVNLRVMYPKKDGRIMAGLGAREPALGDHLLQPREVAFLPMFDPDTKATKTGDPSVDGRTIGAFFAESLMKDARQTMFAEIEIDKAPAGAWTGKLVTGTTNGATALIDSQPADNPAAAPPGPMPKDKEALSLFRKWQDGARLNGNIPGGALGSLARVGTNFVNLNPTNELTPKIAEWLKRIDMKRDWTPAEAAKLLDEITALYQPLPSWAEGENRFRLGGPVQTGKPLPEELKNAPWGEAQQNGLRVAWLLDPNAKQHALGTPLKSRILFHNAGEKTVLFRALTWNQSGAHKARDAKGAAINVTSVEWTTIPMVIACRLAPGEFVEVRAAGIGVGSTKETENSREISVGSWVEAKVGDEVTFTAAPVSATGNFTDERAKGEPGWWLNFIKDRLSQDSPLPADAAERERLLNRAVRDLFGTAPTPEETAAFVTDRTPDAFDALAKRLAQRAGTSSFTGTLQSGDTTFRVLPVDPDAAKKPRVATGPGQYTLGGNAKLVVTRRPDGERVVNEARIIFSPPEETKPQAHEIKLPDGYNTWAAAWEPGATVLWLQQKGAVRSYDFTNQPQVKETQFADSKSLEKVPKPILDTLRAALDQPKQSTTTPK